MRHLIKLTFLLSAPVFFNVSAQSLQLATDLKHDIARIKQHGCLPQNNLGTKSAYYSVIDVLNDLRVFKKIANLNLSTYKFTKKVTGYVTINTWKNNTVSIYKFTMAAPVDTIFNSENIKTDGTKEKFHVKTVFHYAYYLVQFKSDLRKLTYLTQQQEGVTEYSINNKTINLSYEAVPLEPAWPYQKFKTVIKNSILF
jgi:hypothetical protein